MDDFKAEMHKACGCGGIYCYCCNSFNGKDKKKLNRLARRRMKRRDMEQENVSEFETKIRSELNAQDVTIG